jgi:glycosyltransferase involved in cell wall biosynthesis
VIASSDAVPAVLRPYVDVFAPHDVAALRAALERALALPTGRPDAREFARTLTWDRCASQTAEVYRTVLQESSDR